MYMHLVFLGQEPKLTNSVVLCALWLACVAGGFVGVLSGGAAKTSGEAARGMGRKLRHLHFHRAPTKPPATQATLW